MIKKADYLACCYRFIETKSCLKNNECSQSVLRTRINGKKLIFGMLMKNSRKLKVTLIIFR